MAIIKTGYIQKFGTARANLGYITREKTQSGERAILYNQRGEELGKKDIKEVKAEMKDAEMYRRIIFAPDPKLGMNHEQMEKYTMGTLAEYQIKHRTNFHYVLACHDHNGKEHAHVLAWGTREQLYMNKDDMREMRQMALSREETLKLDRALASALKAAGRADEIKPEKEQEKKGPMRSWEEELEREFQEIAV
jgi:hypothetical protein